MAKRKPMQNLVRVMSMKEIEDKNGLKFGKEVIVCVVPGAEKRLVIERRPNRIQYINYRNYFKTLIEQGQLFKEIKQ